MTCSVAEATGFVTVKDLANAGEAFSARSTMSGPQAGARGPPSAATAPFGEVQPFASVTSVRPSGKAIFARKARASFGAWSRIGSMGSVPLRGLSAKTRTTTVFVPLTR